MWIGSEQGQACGAQGRRSESIKGTYGTNKYRLVAFAGSVCKGKPTLPPEVSISQWNLDLFFNSINLFIIQTPALENCYFPSKWSVVGAVASVVVKAAPTETKTRSRLESTEIYIPMKNNKY